MHDRSEIRTPLGAQLICQVALACLVLPPPGRGEDLDLKKLFNESIPDSPFIGVVYKYVDAMLKHGRDDYGPHKTGLLLSALDRRTLEPLETRPPAPVGMIQSRRPGMAGKPLVGANLQMDQNLLRLLYFLRGLSGEDRYPEAADAELKWFLQNAQSATTGLLPWGEQLTWDVITDGVAYGGEQPLHQFARPWMLWERCFQLAPEESKRFALALWTHHMVDQKTGKLSPRVPFQRSGSSPPANCPRQAGFFIRTWAEAFTYTDDETFLKAIESVLTGYENKRRPPSQLWGSTKDSTNAFHVLSMAIDCDGAARYVPEPLKSRLAAFAAREDARFCSLPHQLKQEKGFAKRLEPAATEHNDGYTSVWDPSNGRYDTAAVAMMCVSRYQNTGNVGYRKLIVDAADAYRNSLPEEDTDAWPRSFGQAISLELAAFRITARRKYHARAFSLGEIAIERFFGDNPLPRASLLTDHYESTTGADTLALALAELHLSTRTITAVRTPANTIDR